LIDAAVSHVHGPEHIARPRTARLVRVLADAFAEGIAAKNLLQFDTMEGDEGASLLTHPPLLRSRRSDQLSLLRARCHRIPPRRRPHYTPEERADILTLKHRFRLSNRFLSTRLLLDEGTFSAWSRDVDQPERRKRPLVQTISDIETAVAAVASALPPVPKRLRPAIEETLAALADKIPLRKRRTRKARVRPAVAVDVATRRRTHSPIHPKYPNHYWSSDLSVIRLALSFHLAAIIDLFSRDILAWDLFDHQPSSEEIAALFAEAVARHGKPENFVSDHGGQYIGAAVKKALTVLAVDHREGAVGQHGSIAITERFWRTAKEHLDIKNVRPNVPALLHERVAVVIDYYRTKRPHTAVGNATPDEAYRRVTSRAADARPAPRGWPGEPSPPPPFVIRHAFPAEQKLPYLERVA